MYVDSVNVFRAYWPRLIAFLLVMGETIHLLSLWPGGKMIVTFCTNISALFYDFMFDTQVLFIMIALCYCMKEQ